jgi:siroheme synthase (precorrin-2 oxidase/ferrochelatase)
VVVGAGAVAERKVVELLGATASVTVVAPEACSAIERLAADGAAHTPAVLVRDPYVVAISSGGETPALTRLLREVLEQALPDADWVEAARQLRTKWRREGTPMGSRFPELLRLFRERAKG